MKNIFQHRMVQIGLALVVGLALGMWMFKGVHREDQVQAHNAGIETTWTCSMHPQIRQQEPGKCPICGMDLIPLTSGRTGDASSFVYEMSPEAVALANVQTSKVGYAILERDIELTGKIAVDERKRAIIAANYAGRIEQLFVDFTGQQVRKGQKLASMYAPELVTAQKELLEAAKYKQVNPVLYRAAREKLRLWKVPEKQVEEIEASGEVMAEFDVYADISGVVLNRNVSTGDYVNRGSALFEIADLSTVWVLMDAYESDLSWVRTGAKAQFAVASVPGREFTSTVTFIDPVINPNTRTASVRAEAHNPGLELKPDMFVSASIKTTRSEDEKNLLVPRTGILWTGKRSVVYVKAPNSDFPAFEMREVTLGPRAGEAYAVVEGLLEGEEVITHGVFAVDAAAQLSGNYSMMHRPANKRVGVPEAFTQQVTHLLMSYFDLKNALVESDFSSARQSAEKVSPALASADMGLLNGAAHEAWMARERTLRSAITGLSGATDIEGQRRYFAPLSDAMIEVAEVFGFAFESIYLHYCPMALDDKGAYWLSSAEEISNPYFGDSMLRCGEVRRVIRGTAKVGEQAQAQEHRH